MLDFKIKLNQLQLQVLSNITTRNSGDDEFDTPLKKFMWHGILCSAKYCTLLLSYGNPRNTPNQCKQLRS